MLIDLFSAHPQAGQPSVTLFGDDVLNSFLMSSDVSVQKESLPRISPSVSWSCVEKAHSEPQAQASSFTPGQEG